MKLGLITDSIGSRPFEEALDLAVELHLDTVEIATGNWVRVASHRPPADGQKLGGAGVPHGVRHESPVES